MKLSRDMDSEHEVSRLDVRIFDLAAYDRVKGVVVALTILESHAFRQARSTKPANK